MPEESRHFDLLTTAVTPRALPAPRPADRPALAAQQRRRFPRWTLAQAVEALGPFSPESALLGVAVDDLPVLLDLSDPSPGPLLIVGQQRAGLQRFLFHTARSLTATHPRAEVRFILLSPVLRFWLPLSRLPQSAGVAPIFSRQADALLHAAESWGYQAWRPTHHRYLLLLIDDLARLAAYCEEETFLLISDLLTHGPAHGIWPIVTATSDSLSRVPSAWRQRLGVRIYGQTRAAPLHGSPPAFQLQSLHPTDEYLLPAGQNWLRFSLPL